MAVDTVKTQREAARWIASTMSKRAGLGAPLRHQFLDATEGAGRSPLSSLMSGRKAPSGGGGRGGRTRLALYLTLLWVLAGEGDPNRGRLPHSASRPWRLWAELLGLDDPHDAGGRAARAAARELADRGLIAQLPSKDPTQSPTLVLQHECGTGRPYTIPNPKLDKSDRYLRVPEALWTRGLLARISGPGLAMYLIALDFYRADRPDADLTFGQSYVRENYGIGDSTRRKGLLDLVELDVLDVHSASIDSQGDRFGRLRPRNLYILTPSWRPAEPQRREEDDF